MNESGAQKGASLGLRAVAEQTLDWFASLKLAVVLLVALAAVLAAATLLEKWQGHEYAQWYVYNSPWFMALVGLLALNILAAMIVRFPWRWRHCGFLLAHAGVLILLFGALRTFTAGIDGQLALEEGQSDDTLVMTDRSQLTVVRAGDEASRWFEPGPVDWPGGATLRLRPAGNVKLEVLKFYRHARTEEQWAADSSPAAGPVVQVALLSPDGTPMVQQWLTADPLADEVFLGPVRLEFKRLEAASMLEDFVSPPGKDEGANSDGILSMHYDGRMYRIPVRENVGKKVAVDKSGIRVEIVAYLPDARSDATANFHSVSREPNNPMLELKVYLPGKEPPLRQSAFARAPLFNLDAIHGRKCPVKFWYHHPAAFPEAGVEFLQSPDGKLHYRVIADGKLASHGEVQEGSQIPMAGRLRLAVVKYLPHARQDISFLPVTVADNDEAAAEPAVLVRVQVGDEAHEVWLRREDREFGRQQISTAEGPIAIRFGYERLRLGFALKLVEFRHEMNPGLMGDASFASSVRVIDKARNVDLPGEIAMNQPLVYGGFTFYQSSYSPVEGGKEASILTAASDPGRWLKYLGCLVTCFGVFVVFYGGAFSFLAAPFVGRTSQSVDQVGRTSQSVPENGRVRKSVLPVLALALLTGGAASARAAERDDTALDWRQWQSLPVQEGGRQKPFDTLARETCRTISKRSSFSDPQTQRELDPIALYLTLLFTGQGWDRPQSPHGMPGAAGCPGQPATSKPDAWDCEPLLLVDSVPLRAALGLPADQRYISFHDLARAQIEMPTTGEKSLFLAWAQDLSRNRPRKPNELQRKGLDLAERYLTYQEVRRGQDLEVLPGPDSKTQEWVSVARLVQTKWDDKSDPAGGFRKAKAELQKARAAYLAGAAADFNAASASFIAAVREAGPQLGDYPSVEIIDLEVAYNRWAPFRIAWVCTLAALLVALLGWASRWRPCYGSALALYGAGLLAMAAGFGLRAVIVGRVPVTNMYESVVFVALGTAVFGLVLELVHRRYYVLTAATAVSTLALVLADTCPAILDPSIRPLTPVLRSNFWLAVHVITIMLSYAAFALAWLMGNIALGFHLRRSSDRAAVAAINRLTYKLLQAGVLLLILGTFLGASWGDYAWGRFWGWDAKEVWALVTLLGYLAFLHARRAGWVGHFGMPAFSVLCFTLVLVTWYVVNFVLATGLHSYGFGGGGQGYVWAAVAAQFLFVGRVTVRYTRAATPLVAAETSAL